MAQMKIDQVGLSAGVPGVARKDGKSDGSEVTLTDMTAGGTTLFEILWADPSDTHALSSLLPTADPHVWKFTPSSGVKGPIRVRLTHTTPGGVVTTQTRIFGIPDADGNVPPAPGERSDPNASRGNETDAAVIDRCERNWPTAAFPAGNPYGWGLDLPRPENGGGDSTVIVAASPLTAAPDTAYVCLAAMTVTLPDASSAPNVGHKITLTLTAKSNTVQPSASNYLITQTGGLAQSPVSLPAGTYVFQAVYDAGVVPAGIWVMQRLAATFGRRSVDVDWCINTEVPTPNDQVAIAGTTRFYLRANGSTPEQPFLDGSGTLAVGNTVLVPFDPRVAGLFRVNRNNSATDWELELIEPLPADYKDLGEASETEYRIKYGEVWGGRSFLTNTAGNPLLPALALQPSALGTYPAQGDPIDGSPAQNHAFANDGLAVGKVNFIDASTYSDFFLRSPDATRVIGERFAVKAVSSSATGNYNITVPEDAAIETFLGSVGPTTVVPLHIGTYIEWQLMLDVEGLPVWRLVAYYEGTTLG